MIPDLRQSDCQIPNKISAQTVHSSNTNCTVRNLHTSGHVTKYNLQPVNFYIGNFPHFNHIICWYFHNISHSTTCYCSVEPWEETAVEVKSQYLNFDTRQLISECRLYNGEHLVSVSLWLKRLYFLLNHVEVMTIYLPFKMRFQTSTTNTGFI